MRYLLLISPMFHEWPLAISRKLAERDSSAEFMGLVAGKERVSRRVESQKKPRIFPVYRLYKLEREWLETPYKFDELEKYEKIFGADMLNRIVIASRQIGYGWVTGAKMARTPIMKMSKDTELIRRYVVGLFKFYFRMFQEQKPDLVFCYVVAEAPAYCLSKVSEYFGVPFRRLCPTSIGIKHILDDTPEAIFGPVSRTYKMALEDPELLASFLPQAREHLRSFRETPRRPANHKNLTRDGRVTHSLLAIPGQLSRILLAALKMIRPHRVWNEPTDWNRRTWQLRVNLNALRLLLKDPFLTLDEIPDKPFAYFPLHIDPEESTLVSAPYQTNQLAIVEALSKSLPFGMNLVVKEHPGMVGQRPGEFYRDLRKMPKVILVSPFESPFELIQRADLTCVITGTTCWEAMMLKKPVLVLGEKVPYLQIGEGVERCVDLFGLSESIRNAMARPRVSERSLELFIASMLHHSFDFPPHLLWGKVSPQLVEANQTVLEDLVSRLEVAAQCKSHDKPNKQSTELETTL